MKQQYVLFPTILAATLFASCTAKQNQQPKKMNIIYIMTDDHAQQAISAYDGRYNQTPGFDRLAHEGVLFSESFVANSISGPSRACLLTGKHSHKNGFRDNVNDTFDGSQQTFPKLLQKAGYKTAVIGKWHLFSDPTGFDHWDILEGQGNYHNPDFYDITSAGDRKMVRHHGYATDIVTDKGIEWIDKQAKSDQPFCLLLHHKTVHRTWVSDTVHIDMYEDTTFPMPENFYDNYEGRLAAAAQEMSVVKDMDLAYDLKMFHPTVKTPLSAYTGEMDRLDSATKARWDRTYNPILEDFLAKKRTGKELAEWKYQRYMRDYMKCVASLDDNIARLIDHLDHEGLLENTIIVYTSDQGFYLGEHGWFDKRFMYEESMRTPLIVRLPDCYRDAPRGVKVDELVQNIDYAPTLLSYAGVEVPQDMQGESFMEILEGQHPQEWREDGLYYHFYEYPGEHAARKHYGVRDDRYKLIHFYGDDIDCWELYDIENDPSEMQNLYGNGKYSEVQKMMHSKLERLEAKYDAPRVEC